MIALQNINKSDSKYISQLVLNHHWTLKRACNYYSNLKYIKYGKIYLNHLYRLRNLNKANPKRVQKAVHYCQVGHSINSTAKKFHIGKSTLYKTLKNKK